MQDRDVPVNWYLLRGLSSLFNSSQDSDCVIIFCQERIAPDAANLGVKRKVGRDGSPTLEVLGDPIPGHRFVLRHASEHFRTKVCDKLTAL